MHRVLENRTAVITGAGRGIGRAHALLLASLGAKVVVNDPGGSNDGSGTDRSLAQEVADDIARAGGTAIANWDDVSQFDGARRIVDDAVSAFGDLHVVVNNAGILRDRMLTSMAETDFDAVISVHLKGTFNVSRHAAEWWRARAKAGDAQDRAIVNTSSSSGLHGNVGQGNYAAAKAGIAAMTVVHAMELRRYGVRVNCISPVARTRLTEATPGIADAVADNPDFDPDRISPLVACLAAPDCPFTGQVFSVYGGCVGIYQGWSIHDEVVTDGAWSVEELADAMLSLPTNVPVRTQGESVQPYLSVPVGADRAGHSATG